MATRTPPPGSHDAVAQRHVARTPPPQPGPTAMWHGPITVVGPILSTWRCGSNLTEPAGPVSTRALYSGTVPRPGGTPRQRRPLRSRSHSTVLWATTEYNTLPLWAFAYLLGRLSLDLPRGPSAWPLGRQSSFFPSRPSVNRQKTCTSVSQDSNRIPDGSQEKALPLRH